MKIMDLQRDIEQSLANLPTAAIPAELEGLRRLPVDGHIPRVSIHYVQGNRKVREDAAVGYFDPGTCVVTIKFVPIGDGPHELPDREYSASGYDEPEAEPDYETMVNQLIDELKKAERTRRFVGLQWFRDRFLADSVHTWARDPAVTGFLVHLAGEKGLIMTSKVPNPKQPLRPVTAVRVNRTQPRLRPDAQADSARFKPVRIRGGSISDTVINERQ